MDRREFLINLAFIVIVLPIVFIIFQGYATLYFKNKKVDLSNPLNLKIHNVLVTEYSLTFQLYNPNNRTYPISIEMIGLRNSFGTVAPVTEGGDIGIIKYLPPHQNTTFYIPIIKGTAPSNVLIQWLKGGGNLTISVYYSVPDTNVHGVIIGKVSK